MAESVIQIRRALISVSDKTGLLELASALIERNVEIISTGGTARALKDAGVMTTPVEEITGFPEIMDGRVKTLHPVIHGGLLALLDQESHVQAMRRHGIEPIDLVVVNLYPFEQTVAKDGVALEEAVEQIDIGGPSMIRSAAKNARRIAVATSPAQYPRLLAELERHNGATTRELRLELMRAAYERTSAYDAAIAEYLAADDADAPTPAFPERLAPRFEKIEDLRYGENPHQAAAIYRDPDASGPSIAAARQLHGKPLSFNNVADAAAALELVIDLRRVAGRPAAAIIKHANPCGAAAAASTHDAARLAMEGDPLAAFGGIVAVSDEIDEPTAERLAAENSFLEVIIGPTFAGAARDLLRARWANVRLLEVGDLASPPLAAREVRTFRGGALVQSPDAAEVEPAAWTHAAGPEPTAETLAAAALVWIAAKHLRSNAVAVGGVSGSGVMLFGGGAGQMDRVASCRLAVAKAGDRARGAIAASDAFFPFPDGPEILIDAGVAVIVHPGGSRRDQETLDLCEKRGVTCLLTGVRHFKH